MPLGRTSGPNPPNWGNDSLFFWTRIVDFIFIVAIGGGIMIDGIGSLWMWVLQAAIAVLVTTRLRARRRRWWERSQERRGEAVA
jgi:hypothetical protein